MNETCRTCVHWKRLGTRVNTDGEVQSVGMCKNKRALDYKRKTVEDFTCDDHMGGRPVNKAG